MADVTTPAGKKPPWFKITLTPSESYQSIKDIVRTEGLHTVCQ